MKRKPENRWADTAVGKAGEPLAEALVPAVQKWLALYGKDNSPWDLASIAYEVALQVAAETGLIRAWNSKTLEKSRPRKKAVS